MRHIEIKTHKPTHSYPEHSLFVLSKGNNAGKPLDAPCPNCFVIVASCDAEKTELRWICYMLWQSGIFRRHLIGSVIEFIRIADARNCIEEALNKADMHNDFTKIIHALQAIADQQENFRSQVRLLEELKLGIIGKAFRTDR